MRVGSEDHHQCPQTVLKVSVQFSIKMLVRAVFSECRKTKTKVITPVNHKGQTIQ